MKPSEVEAYLKQVLGDELNGEFRIFLYLNTKRIVIHDCILNVKIPIPLDKYQDNSTINAVISILRSFRK